MSVQPFRKIFLFLLFSLTLNVLHCQQFDYREIFGENWQKALTYEYDNRNWIEPLLEKYDISYPEAIAVIFPELVRYSALRDKMEITLLKALYINLGDDYANFSIGRFQMKPSFAWMIREQADIYLGRKFRTLFKQDSDTNDIKNYRKQIVTELENPQTQMNYLIAFLKICEKKYKPARKDEVARIKFLSTAYNYGIDKSGTQIDSMADSRFFNTKIFSTENYSYSDVSLFWYNQFQKGK